MAVQEVSIATMYNMKEATMRNTARDFMNSELGGQFYENSVTFAFESFSARVEIPFTYDGYSYKAEEKLVMDENGNIVRARFA